MLDLTLYMSPEILAYPFLFIAIFFETFILVTFLSKPARLARARRGTSNYTPRVAIIVPCYNEAATVGATCESLLALEYPKDKLEIILVDDGSKDATPQAMAAFANNPQVKILRKENGGKHTALNDGIAMTSAEFFGCLDADSFVASDALREIIPCFSSPRVAATTAAMSVHQPSNLLQHMQNAEYIFGITLRHSLASVNGIYVTPGPFSLYRRSVIDEIGGFRKGHQTEDLEMALRIQHAGYEIENAPRARVYTKAPTSIPSLIKQRTRWTTGFLRNALGEYRGLIGNSRHGALGTLVLPIGILSILSGIGLFLVAMTELIRHTIVAFSIRNGIPLSYSLVPRAPQLDWFYMPSSFYFGLIVLSVIGSISMMLIGKRLSRTPGSIGKGIAAYLLLYGFIAPLWLMRASYDVATNTKRSWR